MAKTFFMQIKQIKYLNYTFIIIKSLSNAEHNILMKNNVFDVLRSSVHIGPP